MPAILIKTIFFPHLIVFTAFLLFFSTQIQTSAEAASICRVYNFRNIQSDTKPIPHIQWRRCRIAGKTLFYLRIFNKCESRDTCTDGWIRAMRRGRHYISTYKGRHIKRSIRFHLPTLDKLKMYARTEYLHHNNFKSWQLSFRRY